MKKHSTPRVRLFTSALKGRAEVQRLLGNHKGGIADYEHAISFCTKHHRDDTAVAEMLIAIASIYLLERSDVRTAEGFISKAMKKIKKKRDAPVYVQALYHLGTIAKNRGRYDKALHSYEKSYRIFRAMKDKRGCAISLDNIGNIHSYRGDFDRALENYKKSLSIFRSIDDTMGIGTAANSIGIIHQSRGELDEALKYYQESLVLFEKIGYQRGICISSGNIGILFAMKDDLQSSLKYFNRSLLISDRLGDRVGLSFTSGNIGIIHLWRGNLENAFACFRRCFEISDAIGDKRGKGTALGNIASIYLYQGKFKAALDSSTEYLSLSKSIRYPYGRAAALYKMGEIFIEQEKFYEAKDALEKARRIYEQINHALELPKVDALLSRILSQDGEDEAARRVAMDSLAHARKNKVTEYEILALRTLAWATISSNPKQAESFSRKAVELSKKSNRKLEMAKSLYDHANTLLELGKAKRASMACDKAAAIFRDAKAHLWLAKVKKCRKRITQSSR